MILTADQLEEVTGKQRSNAQARELDYLGIPFQRRRDGSIIVLRATIEGRTHATQKHHAPALRLP